MTVPAASDDGVKASMRNAALRAGIIPSEDSDALTILLEPEAAALHMVKKSAHNEVNDGERALKCEQAGVTPALPKQ